MAEPRIKEFQLNQTISSVYWCTEFEVTNSPGGKGLRTYKLSEWLWWKISSRHFSLDILCPWQVNIFLSLCSLSWSSAQAQKSWRHLRSMSSISLSLSIILYLFLLLSVLRPLPIIIYLFFLLSVLLPLPWTLTWTVSATLLLLPLRPGLLSCNWVCTFLPEWLGETPHGHFLLSIFKRLPLTTGQNLESSLRLCDLVPEFLNFTSSSSLQSTRLLIISKCCVMSFFPASFPSHWNLTVE